MKKLVLYAVLCMIFIGCGTTSQTRVNLTSYNESQRQAYEAWRAIDMDNLTEGQQETLANLKGEVKLELSGFELAIVNDCPWIDANHLTNRDKVFLGDLMGAMLAAHAANSNR